MKDTGVEMNIIQSMWVGPRLSLMEQLAITSFISNGQEFHLYTYSDLENVPPGTVIRDANEILPDSMIFQYKEHASYAGFANFFRYKLLLERGGWWVDTDMVCLRPFVLDSEYVFSSEMVKEQQVINSGVIRAPRYSIAMEYCWDQCQTVAIGDLKWGTTGPRLVQRAVEAFSLERFVSPYDRFCPIGYNDWASVVEPALSFVPKETTLAIHLWNEMWRRNGRDKDGSYPEDCLYEELKNRYLGAKMNP